MPLVVFTEALDYMQEPGDIPTVNMYPPPLVTAAAFEVAETKANSRTPDIDRLSFHICICISSALDIHRKQGVRMSHMHFSLMSAICSIMTCGEEEGLCDRKCGLSRQFIQSAFYTI